MLRCVFFPGTFEVSAALKKLLMNNVLVVPDANMQIFPPNNGGGDRGRGGYQTLGSPTGMLSKFL